MNCYISLSEYESNLGFEYNPLIVVELIILLSLGWVKVIGSVPIYSVLIIFILVLSILLCVYGVNFWLFLLLGLIYISGVVVLMVYVGACSLFEVAPTTSYVVSVLALLTWFVYMWESSGCSVLDIVSDFALCFSSVLYILLVSLLIIVIVIMGYLLGGCGGTMRV